MKEYRTEQNGDLTYVREVHTGRLVGTGKINGMDGDGSHVVFSPNVGKPVLESPSPLRMTVGFSQTESAMVKMAEEFDSSLPD